MAAEVRRDETIKNAYDMLKALMLRFSTWVKYQSGSSQKIETTSVISDREGICAGIWLPSDGRAKKPNRRQGASAVPRAGGTVPRGGITRAPEARAIIRS